jgi:SAM-dependent methyltransferase
MNPPYKCEICDSEHLTPLHLGEMMFGGSGLFLYLQCKDCETTYQAEKLEDYSQYYPKSYYSFQYQEPKNWSGKVRRLKRRLRNQYYYFNKGFIGRLLAKARPCPANHLSRHVHLRLNMSILEIGCGSGEMLHELGDIGVRRLSGVDPYIDQEINFDNGVKIYRCATQNLLEIFPNQKFDLIIFNHSLEHSLTPVNDLNIARHLLSEGGEILIRIPVSGSTIANQYKNHWWSLDAPRHIYIFSKKSMALIAERAGLVVNRTHDEGTIDDYIASEQHKKGIYLLSEQSYVRTKDFSGFSQVQLSAWDAEIALQNRQGTAAQAGFILKRA